MRKTFAAIALASFAAACGSQPPLSPSAVTPATSVSGPWYGIGTDSSSSLGPAGMMGQANMGTMTWQLSQNGAEVRGSMTFSGSSMAGHMPGTLMGTMSGDDMDFTMDMPIGSMMGTGCSSRATGTMHLDRATMTMTGTYSGSNTCFGAFTGGQMTMNRR